MKVGDLVKILIPSALNVSPSGLIVKTMDDILVAQVLFDNTLQWIALKNLKRIK